MKKNITKIVMLLFVLTGSSFFAQAQDAKADKIMKTHYDLPEAKDSRAEIKLELINSKGNKITRSLVSYAQKTDAGTNSFIEVTAPADIAGMRLLSTARKGEDDQRMFLPAFGKSRKISGSGKTGKFLGSDIYFYDLEDHDLEDFVYTLNSEKTLAGQSYYLITAKPKDTGAPYSKSIHWINKNDYFVYKSELYDTKGKLLKTIDINEIQIISGVIIPVKMTITNHKDNHTTIYQTSGIKLNTGLSGQIFTVQNLEK